MKALLPLVALASAFALVTASVAQDEPSPDRRPERPERPELPEKPERPERPERPEAPELGELREHREMLTRRLDELLANGQEREAAETKEQLARVNRELAGRERRPGEQREPRPPARPLEMRARRPEPSPGPEQRHQHLREAMEHLRAAGMPELAERVGDEGKRRIVASERGPRPEGRSGEGDERLEQMQRHLRELHGAVENLQRQVERLSHERARQGPGPSGPRDREHDGH